MQPTNSSPEAGAHRAPELSPQKSSEFFRAPERPVTTPELAESQPQPNASGSTLVTPLPQLPVLPAPQQPNVTQVPASDTNPVAANDDDVMEKAWVDKAKRIVAQTKDDPYTQEKEVSKLQADYLKKRYGKEIKLSGD